MKTKRQKLIIYLYKIHCLLIISFLAFTISSTLTATHKAASGYQFDLKYASVFMMLILIVLFSIPLLLKWKSWQWRYGLLLLLISMFTPNFTVSSIILLTLWAMKFRRIS